MKGSMIKKFAAFLLAGCLMFSMGACGTDKNTPAQSTADTTASEDTAAASEDTGAVSEETGGADSPAAADSSSAQSEAAGTAQSTPDGSTVSADFDAKAYIEMLFTGDVDELTKTYGHEQELIDALEPQGGFEGLKDQLKVLGDFKGAGEPVVSEVQGYTSYSVPCEFSVQNVNIVINVDSENKVGGIFTAEYTAGGETQASLPSGLVEKELNVPVPGKDGWELPGTLTFPEGEGPFPAVILVHGSGTNDRDETIGPNKPFRDLAWGLAEKGIAVLRYDKRTYVYQKEMITETNLTLYDETVDDAVSAVNVLLGEENIDSSRIFMLGHSLGGEALPRIHNELTEGEKEAAGYIFMAAPARPASVSMKEQLDLLYALSPSLTKEQEAQKEQSYVWLKQLENINKQPDDAVLFGAYAYYWKDLESYDPVAEASTMAVPCFVIQGEEDYQVTMDDYALWQEAYGSSGNWTFASYPGLTHLFMPGKKANGSADYMTAAHVDSNVIDDIAAFVSGE